jgi:hypothetical protein
VPRDVIAAEALDATFKSVAPAKTHELLERRIEIGVAPDKQIEALDDQWREIEAKLASRRFDAKPSSGRAAHRRYGRLQRRLGHRSASEKGGDSGTRLGQGLFEKRIVPAGSDYGADAGRAASPRFRELSRGEGGGGFRSRISDNTGAARAVFRRHDLIAWPK